MRKEVYTIIKKKSISTDLIIHIFKGIIVSYDKK